MPRERLLVALLVAALVPLVVLGARVAATPSTSDFLCVWTGPRLLFERRDPYDTVAWTSATSGTSVDAFDRTRGGNCAWRYLYPLTTAIAMAPLGALPLGLASWIWELGILVATAAGVSLLARAAELPRRIALLLAFIVVVSEPFFQTVLSAQFGGLMTLGVALLAAPRLGAARGAAGLVVTMLKPHAVPLAPLVRIRDVRAGLALRAAAPAIALLAVSLLVDPTWPATWIGELAGHRREMFGVSVSVWKMAEVAGAPAWIGGAIAAPALVVLALAMRGARDLRAIDYVAVAAVAWQMVVPYGLSGDQLAALAVVWAATLRRAGSPLVAASTLASAVVLPWLLYGLRFDLLAWHGLQVLNALVPIAAALVLALALSSDRGASVASAG